jgi:uncharacterized membrane protein
MADTNATGGQAPVAAQESPRMYAIIVYALYLAAFCNGLTAVIGLIIAYIKRDEARGTIYESHFANAIETFWVGLVIGLVAIPLVFLFGLGVLVWLGVVVWYLFRTIKGLVRVLDAKPYY